MTGPIMGGLLLVAMLIGFATFLSWTNKGECTKPKEDKQDKIVRMILKELSNSQHCARDGNWAAAHIHTINAESLIKELEKLN
jgi:hypothetical protein